MDGVGMGLPIPSNGGDGRSICVTPVTLREDRSGYGW